MLFSPQELQAVLALLNRAPMSQAEQLFTQGFFERLVAHCRPSKPEPVPAAELTEEQAEALMDDLARTEAMDKEARNGKD